MVLLTAAKPRLLCVCLLAGTCAQPVLAEVPAYTPASEAEVLARVSPAAEPGPAALRAARLALATSPRDAAVAADYAARALALGRAQADPRYFGVAEAALAPWWTLPAPPPAIRLLRATLRQQRHDFVGALSDLDALIAANPRDAGARLLRAVVLQVQGRPRLALPDCAALIGQTGLLTATTCLASARALNGQAAPMLAALAAVLATPAAAAAPAEERRWALTIAAEIAARLGRTALTSQYFEQADALARDEAVQDVYLQAAWADFDLARGQAAAVAARLGKADIERLPDALLLRLALAERRLAETGPAPDSGRWRTHAELLAQRQASARARGETSHVREEAMLALRLRADAPAALRLALANWAVQREPADALILLEAAQAAGQPQAADPVRQWLLETGLEDRQLRALAGLPEMAP